MSRKITQVRINHNPYINETILWIDDIELNMINLLEESYTYNFEEWVRELVDYLIKLNAYKLSILFCGITKDWIIIKNEFSKPEVNKILNKPTIKFKQGVYYKDFIAKVAAEFSDLRRFLIIDDPDNEILQLEYKKIRKPYFRINVVATMSSGKSTLINALLGKKLFPSRNEACTSSIIEILDTDQDMYTATVYDGNNNIAEEQQKMLNEKKEVSLEDIDILNQDPEIARISIEGDMHIIFINKI